MYIIVVLFHVLACIGLIMIVLLQRGKGADLGAAFGGSSQTVFGSQGAGGFLTRLTTIVAVVFMLTSLGLAYLSSHRVQATVMGKPERVGEVGQQATSEQSPYDVQPAEEEQAGATEQPTEEDWTEVGE